MNYLFYGTEHFLISQEIKRIKEENNIDEFSYVTYDFDNSNILDILEDAKTVPLFSDKKMIVCTNSSIFQSQSKKNITDKEIDLTLEYIENSNPTTILIFVSETIDNKRKATTRIKKNGIVKEFNKSNNVYQDAKNMFEGYKIDSKTLDLLINRVGKNISALKQESDKLKAYKYDEKIITTKDVLDCTEQKIEGNIFDLIDNIVYKNKNQALAIYDELLKSKESPVKIMVMLSNYFRTLYQAKTLLSKGHSENEIATILEAKPYYINQVLKKGRNIPIEKTLEYLEKLADLDYKIKTSTVEQEMALELFIIEN